MLYNGPIRLTVSTRRDLFLPVWLLNALVVLAALLSPHPVLLTLAAVLVFAAVRAGHILKLSKTNNVELTSVIFPDGRVRLESDQEETIEGFMDGQQWCTRRLAVLRVANENTTRHLVIRPKQQQGTDEFRRLNVWLRQDLCNSTSE
jgi:hypothetical protein